MFDTAVYGTNRFVECVFEERVVKRPHDEHPAKPCREATLGVDDVFQDRCLAVVFDFEKMHTLESAGQPPFRIESKNDPLAMRVRVHSIAHGTVTSRRSRRERPVEAHRGPAVVRPKAIVVTGQTVNERTHRARGRR